MATHQKTLRSMCLLFVFLIWKMKEVKGYNAAVVEYVMDDEIFSNLPPLDLGNRNAKIYNEIVGRIKLSHKILDLVVFPEGTLVGDALDTPEGRKGMTFVPSPKEAVIPCNSSIPGFSEFFKVLSCTARKYSTYLVINLKEKEISRDKVGAHNGFKFFNTDVVFDRNGKVIARYRKYNTYLEPDTDKPKTPELVTFDTDFGKTFGIFTCFDLLFKSPAMDLVRKGISNFIFPTMWFSELPFHTTIQIQQSWAQGNDVALLTSGASDPTYGTGGLGIFLGARGTLATVDIPHSDNYYLFKEVPDIYNFTPSCKLEVDNRNAKKMDKYNLYIEDLTEYAYKKLDLRTSKTIEETLCQTQGNETLCCHFQIETEILNADSIENKFIYDYFLVTRSGLRTYGNNTYILGIEMCGLIACTGPSIMNCGQRFPDYDQVSWPIIFKRSAYQRYSTILKQEANFLIHY
ncbi:hypothetical protein HHI36_011063 [Cryptolaemus montrouzieri]|uniref:CN hydrolase domain-containing protein n=1 Tax=Cryptolaemus montrouzieri TaxID=559131 RepID=A0ABD2MKN2_9CUCU